MSLTILIIDDETSLCDLLEFVFREEGYCPTIAHDASEAFQNLETTRFDVILTDMTLSGTGGIEIINYAKNIYPDSHYFLMTGYELNDSQKNQLEKLSCQLISKPFKLKDISQLIRSATN